jgi:6-pyruvoyltetrahydropterin/6-carboxytetrahydropterin synthase
MQITKIIRFEAAHRLLGYEGACSNIHGHSYKVEMSVENEVNPDTGMVTDFKNIKNTIGLWINENWDHALIIEKGDPFQVIDTKMFIMNKRPTAENMVEFLLAKFPNIHKIKIWETETSYAEVSR